MSEVLPRGWENGVFGLLVCCCIFVSVHWVKIIMNECLEQRLTHVCNSKDWEAKAGGLPYV